MHLLAENDAPALAMTSHPQILIFRTHIDNKYEHFAQQKIKVIIRISDQDEWGETQYSYLLWLFNFLSCSNELPVTYH